MFFLLGLNRLGFCNLLPLCQILRRDSIFENSFKGLRAQISVLGYKLAFLDILK